MTSENSGTFCNIEIRLGIVKNPVGKKSLKYNSGKFGEYSSAS